MQSERTIPFAPPIRAPWSLIAAVSTVVATFRCWQDRWNGRRDLEELEPRLLDDIGISREQALREARKPFWRR